MRYNSKKDWWIGIIIWVPMAFGLYETAYEAFAGELSFIFFILFALLVGFVAWIWFGTYYVFEEESLIIKCGPIKEFVPFKKIISVKKTRNPLSSVALSIDRIEITYGSIVLISPVKKEEFLAELRKRCNYSFVEKNVR
ncbi:MAG: PH domain-containing protein [Ruminiclostridium sp.]|nr:PH domain-containing protein [Ruminiclostridium sp.]